MRRVLLCALLCAALCIVCTACPPRRPTTVRAVGGVLLDCQPKDAELYVDDRYVGVIKHFRGRAIRLRVGLRRLQLSRDGYFDHFAEVRVVKGVRQKLQIKLRRQPF
ncbi:MAG: PEGA domain-containing protein [Myxococcales bacterium]|nr:PEGA domain-containing protein [Myxococcales bacterium]